MVRVRNEGIKQHYRLRFTITCEYTPPSSAASGRAGAPRSGWCASACWSTPTPASSRPRSSAPRPLSASIAQELTSATGLPAAHSADERRTCTKGNHTGHRLSSWPLDACLAGGSAYKLAAITQKATQWMSCSARQHAGTKLPTVVLDAFPADESTQRIREQHWQQGAAGPAARSSLLDRGSALPVREWPALDFPCRGIQGQHEGKLAHAVGASVRAPAARGR